MQRNTPEGNPVLIWAAGTMLDGKLVTPTGGRRSAILIASVSATAGHAGYVRMASRFGSEGHIVLLADLLNPDEQQIDSRTGHYRTDLPLLTERLRAIVNWLQHEVRDAKVIFFGSGVVAAAALQFAASHRSAFSSLILADPRLDLVDVTPNTIAPPLLLLVSETDPALIATARRWSRSGDVQMVVITHDASNICDADNAIETIIDHSAEWIHANHADCATVS